MCNTNNWRSARTKRNASRTGVPPRGAFGDTRNSDASINSNEANTAANDSPFNMKHQPVPNGPTNAAAKAGPKMRDPVITAVFNDIALLMSAGGTSSTTKPRRAGLSNAFTTPKPSASTYTTGTDTLPARSRAPNSTACPAINVCVVKQVVRLSRRSDSAPAQAPNSSIGRNCSATVMPRSVALPVSRYTKMDMAVDCNHVPTLDTINPPKNNRALRLRRDRNVSEPAIDSVVQFQGRNEDVAGHLDAADGLHLLLAFLLLLQKFALTRDVSAVTLGQHVLALGLHGLA